MPDDLWNCEEAPGGEGSTGVDNVYSYSPTCYAMTGYVTSLKFNDKECSTKFECEKVGGGDAIKVLGALRMFSWPGLKDSQPTTFDLVLYGGENRQVASDFEESASGLNNPTIELNFDINAWDSAPAKGDPAWYPAVKLDSAIKGTLHRQGSTMAVQVGRMATSGKPIFTVGFTIDPPPGVAQVIHVARRLQGGQAKRWGFKKA